MENLHTIWWTPEQEYDFAQQFPELDQENAETVLDDPLWPDGYNWVEQELTNEEFTIVDGLANNHVCIDIKPGPRPPGSPLGR